ncbi:MAG: LLM class flavin-dependent oxidoreductase [Anaerolineales bacterium]|nr:LLM class flavin-dependent oxidoreductase [Anaerolineales bacterium]
MQVTIALQTDKRLAAYGPLAALVEGYGFDGVTVYNDMLYQPAWPALFAMAQATSRIRLGPAAVNPFTSHPINIAGQAALLAEAAPGRSYLGLARGAWLDYVGVQVDRPVAALIEAFACIRHLLRGDKRSLAGDHFPLAGGDSLRWALPEEEIPMLLGSWGLRTIRQAQPYVTEVKLGGSANPAVVPWLKGQLSDPPAVVLGAVTVVAEDGARARALVRREVALYLPVVASLDPTVAIEPDRLARIKAAADRFDFEAAAADISDEILAQFAFAGTPAQLIDHALRLHEAGLDRLEFGTPHGLTAAEGLRLLGEKVLPAIRRETGTHE